MSIAVVTIVATVALYQLWRVPRVWAFLLMFVVLAPKIPISAVPGNTTPIRVDDLVIAAVLGWWLFRRLGPTHGSAPTNGARGFSRATGVRMKPEPSSPVTFFVLLYWSVALVCTAVGVAALTTAPLTGVLHFARTIEYGLLFFFFFSTIDPDELDRFVEAFRTTLLIVCGIWIVQHWTHAPAGTSSPWATLYPTFSATYDFGAYLVLATVVLYALWMTDPGSRSVWTTIALVAGGVVTAVSDSRTSVATLALVVVADIIAQRRWRAALVLVPMAVAIPFVITSRKMLTLVHGTSTFVTSFDTSAIANAMADDRSLALRARNWTVALDHWRQRPLLGDGLGGHLLYARQYDVPSTIDGWYVRVLADTGLAGLLAFGLLLAALLWTLVDAARREPQPRRRAIVYGAALAVVAASVSAVLVDAFVSYKIMGVFWMIAGIGTRLAAKT